ncbi:symmetrical bis(5'-nucleosyl)-tetraphosphatase [Piscinibacter sp. XHJ-5]|uniref:symmetrical bis(5'-nucleosyl)-tetraphosphatase n=1 Tax=Piscinibacter sp. XHJ-5 TaxID=3037797 RepID=UPI00245292F7|nr:symmetrical bis(5'-nucleosyl)-tetraphosphatase [Piscinibacter sp. XHJ-5]
MNYIVGDVQGCGDALDRLLERIDFSPSRDHVVVLGDLVNRGPKNLATLQRLRGLGASATCLLGNHDLHLLAVAHGLRSSHGDDTLADILESPQRAEWIAWLRAHRLAVFHDGWLMVHAGVVPQWDLETTLRLAGEVEQHLRSDNMRDFLSVMYGNEPSRWDDSLGGADRLRFTVNVLTRIRFVQPDGTLELKSKEGAGKAPPGVVPWFEAPARKTQGVPIAFGHWSALGLVNRPDLLALDTGCVWGGQLTAVRVDGGRREVIQVPCGGAPRAR